MIWSGNALPDAICSIAKGEEIRMNVHKAICGLVVLTFLPALALAQEDPEAVYAKLHKATLAAKADEVLSYASAKNKAELNAEKGKAQAVIQFMSKLIPQSYTITERRIEASTATLRGTGTGGLGNSAMYLNADFVKEAGAWKVDQWGWSSDKPSPLAAAESRGGKPAPKGGVVAAPLAPGSAPVAPAAAEPARTPKPMAQAEQTPRRPSRAHLDARECLGQPTAAAVARCAEKFR